MAKKEQLSYFGSKFDCVNIDQPVGRGQTNRREDVQLVQAMLEKLAEANSPTFIGARTFDDVPEPTGNFEDGKTDKAIWNYQRKYAKKLLRVDGVVHPAAYTTTDMKPTDDWRRMTITLLHEQLFDSALMSGWGTYWDEIKRTVPELSPFLK